MVKLEVLLIYITEVALKINKDKTYPRHTPPIRISLQRQYLKLFRPRYVVDKSY